MLLALRLQKVAGNCRLAPFPETVKNIRLYAFSGMTVYTAHTHKTDFPEFVARLLQGMFKAKVHASIRHIRSPAPGPKRWHGLEAA